MPTIGDEVEVWKPGDANHERWGRVTREIPPPAPSGMWPTRRYEVGSEDGSEKAEYAEFQLRRVKEMKR